MTSSLDFVRVGPGRRAVLAGLSALGLSGLTPGIPAAESSRETRGFSFASVVDLARQLRASPYQPPSRDLPPALAALDYDGLRQLGFRDARGLWADQALPFQVQFFHRGGLFPEPVQVFEVADGVAQPVAYDPGLFRYGAGPLSDLTDPADPRLGFAGLRLLHPLNTPDKFDEVAAFLGASYFRAVARGGVYGASARGLAIGAGEPDEEFPRFTTFWLDRPARGAQALRLYALMDSPSLTGAYAFVITPGEPTLTDVQAELFPRRDVAGVGLANMTSMFLLAPQAPSAAEDFRPRIHDSDGLMVATAQDERLWRPLNNPPQIAASGFQGPAPQGFGLAQRADGFEAYQDLEARYDLRPSLWATPGQGFASGEVRLVEIPATDEMADNILADWRLAAPLRAGAPHAFSYRLAWGRPSALAPGAVRRWREGPGDAAGWRRVLLDITAADARPTPWAEAGGRPVRHLSVTENPVEGGWRMTFEFEPGAARTLELRASLGASRNFETWVRQWLA